jgi:hypothetical protein
VANNVGGGGIVIRGVEQQAREGEEGEEEEEAGGNNSASLSTSSSTTKTRNTRGREEGGGIDRLLLPSLNRATTKALLRRWGRAGNVRCEACEAQWEGGGDGVNKHLDNLVVTLTRITTGPPPPHPPDPTIVGNRLVGGGVPGGSGRKSLRSAIPMGYE